MELAAFLAPQKLLLWGLGKEGLSSYRFLRRHFPQKPLAVADARPEILREDPQLAADRHVSFLPQGEVPARLAEFDLVLKAPGVPIAEFDLSGRTERISGQADLFLRFAPGRVVGVTGTKGKSTTSALLHHLLRPSQGAALRLGGNFGIPLWDFIEELEPGSCTVAELSSYQLETVRHSPAIAVWLNLYEEHLNYHRTFAAYAAAKANLARFLSADGHLVYWDGDPRLAEAMAGLPRRAQRHAFNGDSPFPFRQPARLPGRHNRLNALAALTAARLVGIDEATVQDSLDSFQSLPHRLEYLGEAEGVRYYNDSISTVPEATLAALEALPETRTLIVGGMDRGISYDGLARELASGSLRRLILLPDTGKRIAALLQKQGALGFDVREAKDLEEAVALARDGAGPGEVCLFSPAASSYHRYRNFEERGEAFRALVRAKA
ncbi:MAG: UDP-N-acetylmuramoyl-L-alanine--D-glutamate ligase [Verrucomicrobium sp.]|nr:UDP-N-acetylmuramoyl-L-alanine--D-glutamate ligase [Verrucomicrobium sp.]